MRIFLIRHGQSLGNVNASVHAEMADHAIPLSDRGVEQSREAGQRLHEIFSRIWPPDDPTDPQAAPGRPHIRLWTSPYTRTRQTADALCEAAGGWFTDRREHILLCEQQFGLFDGISDDLLPDLYPNEWAYYQKALAFEGKFWARFPLGESRFDVAQRVHQSFGSFQRDRVNQGIEDIVVVCHGVTLRAFVMMWCHHPPEWFEAEHNPRNTAIRLIEDGVDRGYLFNGFPRAGPDKG